MERFWFGFLVAIAIITGFLAVKSVAEECREKVEHRVKQLAEAVLNEQFRKWTGCYLVDLDKFVDKRIDLKLEEKEGEHEAD